MGDVPKTGQFGTEDENSKTNESLKPGATISNNPNKDEYVSFNDSKRAPVTNTVQLNSTSQLSDVKNVKGSQDSSLAEGGERSSQMTKISKKSSLKMRHYSSQYKESSKIINKLLVKGR